MYRNVQDCMQMAYGYKKSYGKRRSSKAAYWRGVRDGKRMVYRRRY